MLNTNIGLAAATSQQFVDVKGHWVASYIDNVNQYGDLVNGVTDTEFQPNRSITRAEFTSLLVRTFVQQPLPGQLWKSNVYSDVHNEWFAWDISLAAACHLIDGYEDGTFRPNAPISREEMAAIVTRTLERINGKVLHSPLKERQDEINQSFLDHTEISEWSYSSIATVFDNNIMTGYGNKFHPKANTSRAEAVAVISKTIDWTNN